eukprot:CAMPEP_0181318874 /NCGR_PEP_ID=MMETSP1101-20121128/17247_1 /TAXON_ID=46948 /ORGANISM="Rhodomonas abbreviata, Strain Caron Lab Isolate" /LENGTH=71 /DNA_ID=CAMNT_0023426389 /DNA_START=153 /DNA_END=364 /DNA_ORIENTATION=-
MSCAFHACNSRGCNPWRCKGLYDQEREEDELYRVRAMIYRCTQPGVCEQPDTGTNNRREGFQQNGCLLGHA